MKSNNLGSTPTLLQAIQTVIDSNLIDLHVSLPAKIVTYDPDTQFASVQIQIMFKLDNGSLHQWPVLPDIPVKHSRANGGAAFVHMPLVPGDDVMLICCERSLDNWKTQGGMTDPADIRKFNITDCYALVGGSALPNAFKVTNPTAIQIVNGQTTLNVQPDGKISLKNSSNELIDVLDQITEQVHQTNVKLSTDTVNTIFGPQQLLGFSNYQTIASSLASLKSKLESFKV